MYSRGIVALNGYWDGLDYYRAPHEYSLLVAADGGANYLYRIGLRPDVIIGDLDSIQGEVLDYYVRAGVVVNRYPSDKDKTDSCLALEYAVSRGVDEVVIWGAIGNRIDHTLANLHLLSMSLKVGVPFVIDTHELSIFLVSVGVELTVTVGATLSLLPFTEEVSGITGRGLKYRLQDSAMELGFPYGVSNVAVASVVEIEVKKGVLLVVVFKGGEKSVIPHRFL